MPFLPESALLGSSKSSAYSKVCFLLAPWPEQKANSQTAFFLFIF